MQYTADVVHPKAKSAGEVQWAHSSLSRIACPESLHSSLSRIAVPNRFEHSSTTVRCSPHQRSQRTARSSTSITVIESPTPSTPRISASTSLTTPTVAFQRLRLRIQRGVRSPAIFSTTSTISRPILMVVSLPLSGAILTPQSAPKERLARSTRTRPWGALPQKPLKSRD